MFTLLFLDGLLNWLQNIIAFSVLNLVTPLTYAVANCSKRIFVIGLSLFILGNPVTSMNIVGMLMAIFGVLYYNKVSVCMTDQKMLIFGYIIRLSMIKSSMSKRNLCCLIHKTGRIKSHIHPMGKPSLMVM